MTVQVRPTAPTINLISFGFVYYLLYLVPKNWLSRFVGWSVRCRWPFGLAQYIRDSFIKHFKVDVSESEFPLENYPTLGEFFIRRLRSGARPLGTSALISPVDGMLTQRGGFTSGSESSLTQIKGIQYSLKKLIGEGWDASPYAGGSFLTIYLAPWNYHRIHSPISGRVLRVRHIAGALWPVNRWSVENISELFVRNDRILVEMEGDGGRVLAVMVGATNVGRITVPFCPQFIGNSAGVTGIRDWSPSNELNLAKGDDLGCFEMGSTVVLVLDALWTSLLKNELKGDAPLPMKVGTDLSA